MSLSRRDFLNSGIAVGATLPMVFQQAANAAPKANQAGGDETVLVVIQLTGGNDGLNTVIPFTDPEYAKARPKLKQSPATVLKIDKQLGFHSVMTGFSKLLEENKLAVIQGVGYPNSNRSHFASMDIWHKATKSKKQRFGWLGRAMQSSKAAGSHPGGLTAVNIGQGDGPLALFSTIGHAPSLKSLDDYQLRLGNGAFAEKKRELIEDLAKNKSKQSSTGNGLLSFVKNSAKQTYDSARRMKRIAKDYKKGGSQGYPQTGLANRLKLIARLITGGVPERVFYTSIDGFDTHAAQAKTHPNLIKEVSDAVAAFQKDLKTNGQSKRVLTMTFSEFGRRVRENGSNGTDHGSASQMFLIGDAVKAGVIGEHPSLTDLHQGDLKHHTDFRSVYATVLKQWLKIDPQPILGKKYPLVDALRKRA